MAGVKSSKEEAQALDNILKCISESTKLAAIRCAVQLKIPDILEGHPDGMTLIELSAALGCSPSFLHRIMRLLTHHAIFKKVMKTDGQDSPMFAYTQTPFSRRLMSNDVAHLLLLATSPEMFASKFSLSNMSENGDLNAFEAAYGVDLWQYAAANPGFSELFNKAMSCRARFAISMVVENYKAVFKGIGCLVDVGGGDGTALRAVVKACPWITQAIVFDRPHVVASSKGGDSVEYVGGNMFESVPNADAVMIMSVLHDWDDEACVKILRNCKKAISTKTGKVIILDAVIDDDTNSEGNHKYQDFNLASDIEMLTQTIRGKERTSKEWRQVLNKAGYTRYTINHIPAPQAVIEAYP